MWRSLLSFPILLLLMQPSFAQDAHYWSNNYGPGVFLTPGSVIASNRDSGVLFYNPALLSLSNKSRIAISSISANIYQLESINIRNGAGTGKNLRSRSVRIVPQMLSGSISLGKKAPVVIAYALINAPGLRYQSSQRQDKKFNVLDDSYSPGDEYFVGDYVVENRVSETSALLATGFRLSPKLSAGFSMEAEVHQQHYNVNSNATALANRDIDSSSLPIVGGEAYYLANYVQAGIQFKAGLAYSEGRHHLGLMVSSPLLHIWGRGSIVSNYMLSNIRDPFAKDFYDFMASSRQENLKARWKMPLSIAAGYAYDYGRGQLYFATEYFLRVKDYNILTPRSEAFIRPDTGDNRSLTTDLIRLQDARKSVLNFAVGISYTLKPSITAYCAVRSDMSYADLNEFKSLSGYEAFTAHWDNYHLALGANFKRQQFNFRTGFLLAYGRTRNYPQDVNFDQPNESNLLQGNPVPTTAHRFSAGFMLSYIHNL
jgi:hypothetical protein